MNTLSRNVAVNVRIQKLHFCMISWKLFEQSTSLQKDSEPQHHLAYFSVSTLVDRLSRPGVIWTQVEIASKGRA